MVKHKELFCYILTKIVFDNVAIYRTLGKRLWIQIIKIQTFSSKNEYTMIVGSRNMCHFHVLGHVRMWACELVLTAALKACSCSNAAFGRGNTLLMQIWFDKVILHIKITPMTVAFILYFVKMIFHPAGSVMPSIQLHRIDPIRQHSVLDGH